MTGITTMYAQVLLIACFFAYALADSAQYYALEDADSLFEEFIVKFNKQYIDDLEKAFRFEIFKANLAKTNNLNKDSVNAVFGISKFMDLKLEEFLENNTGLGLNARKFEDNLCDNIRYDKDIPDGKAPESLDWRAQGAVTAVKSQGTCGSCFAFSAVGNVEGQQFMKTKQLLVLSEQQVLDCDPIGSCQGGFMSEALRTLAQFGGSISESDYPYEGQKGQCRSNSARIVTKVTSCISFSLTSQEKLKQLLYQNGPIAIGIKADALHTYHGGILPEVKCKQGQINHGVLLVGYGIDQGEPYWLVKNSWDSEWGEAGYFRIGRSDDPEGACGALNEYMTTAVVSP